MTDFISFQKLLLFFYEFNRHARGKGVQGRISGVPQGSVLGPLFFNVFWNDLFYFLKGVCISAYADDEQIYDSDKYPVKLEMRLQYQLLEADHWFGMNGMITNPDKYQAMSLGNTNYTFSFTDSE